MNEEISIADSTVLVTGAGGGIGTALVTALLDRGAERIIAADKSAPDFTDQRVTTISLDITDEAAVERAANEYAEQVDILINNAGINANQRLFVLDSVAKAQTETAVNYFGTLSMMHHFAPAMVRRGGGQITNIISFVGLVAGPGMASYSASKAAAHMVTVAARAELAPHGVKVMGTYPQVVDTTMSSHLDLPKMSAAELAQEILQGITDGQAELFPGAASQAHNALRKDHAAFQEILVSRLGECGSQFEH